jgi:hypothetical protein
MAVMVAGYSDSMQNKVENTNDILKTHGPAINDILSGRADNTLVMEKDKGAAHAAAYLEKHPEAVRTESGLIFHETTAGAGESPAEVATDLTTHLTCTSLEIASLSHRSGDADSYTSCFVFLLTRAWISWFTIMAHMSAEMSLTRAWTEVIIEAWTYEMQRDISFDGCGILSFFFNSKNCCM